MPHLPSPLKEPHGRSHQFRLDGYVPVGVGHGGMSKIGRKHGQKAFDILVVSVPARQCANRKAMAKVVKPWTAPSWWP